MIIVTLKHLVSIFMFIKDGIHTQFVINDTKQHNLTQLPNTLSGYLYLRYPGSWVRKKSRPKEEMRGNGRASERYNLKVLLLFAKYKEP